MAYFARKQGEDAFSKRVIRKDKYHVMEEQGDGRYFTVEGGKCNSKEDAIELKKRYLLVREKVRLFNQNLRIQLREKNKPNG